MDLLKKFVLRFLRGMVPIFLLVFAVTTGIIPVLDLMNGVPYPKAKQPQAALLTFMLFAAILQAWLQFGWHVSLRVFLIIVLAAGAVIGYSVRAPSPYLVLVQAVVVMSLYLYMMRGGARARQAKEDTGQPDRKEAGS